jgi:serine/threonine protein kinase
MNDCSAKNKLDLKLIDFGLAARGLQHPVDRQVIGTPGYIAPELLMRCSFDHKIDVYSCGIVLYFMLTGSSPFNAATGDEVLELNKQNRIEFDKFPWVTEEARDFIWRLTSTDPGLRLSATEALHSEWLVKNTNQLKPKDLMKESTLKLSSYDFYNDLAREIPSEFDNSGEPTTPKVNRVPDFAIKDNRFSFERTSKSSNAIKQTSDPLKCLHIDKCKCKFIKGATYNIWSCMFCYIINRRILYTKVAPTSILLSHRRCALRLRFSILISAVQQGLDAWTY